MKSTDEIKASAVKLRDLLHTQGIELKHSEAIEAISKLEGYPDWNTHTAYIQKREQIAEHYLDDMLEGHTELNYDKLTQYLTEEERQDYSEKEFLREHTDLHEDLGPYLSREYLGAVSGENTNDGPEEFPEGIRHVWRGVFEKHEVLIRVGIFVKGGTHYVAEASFR